MSKLLSVILVHHLSIKILRIMKALTNKYHNPSLIQNSLRDHFHRHLFFLPLHQKFRRATESYEDLIGGQAAFEVGQSSSQVMPQKNVEPNSPLPYTSVSSIPDISKFSIPDAPNFSIQYISNDVSSLNSPEQKVVPTKPKSFWLVMTDFLIFRNSQNLYPTSHKNLLSFQPSFVNKFFPS